MVLYRKYRPKTFDEVYGQNHITQTLKNQVINDNIAHAMLLYGTRGSGKTTIARIFAKAINCKNPVNGNPCCQCEFCKAIDEQQLTDIVEIDAASNNGVDNIRALIDECRFKNVYLKYKVYIIDEVHMLSTSAFNALLKTLEEPPAHVKFILATTDPQKVGQTIKSRCQKFQFHLLKEDDITSLIKHICEEEGKTIDEDSIKIIVKHANGSMRDALTLLEQVFLYNLDDDVKIEKTLKILGVPEDSLTNDLAESIYKRNVIHSLNILKELRDNGNLLNNIAYSLYDKFKEMFLSNKDSYLIPVMEKVSELIGKLNFTTNGYTDFEISIIQMCIIDSEATHESKPLVHKNSNESDNIDLSEYYKLKYNLDGIPKIRVIRG